MDLETIKHRINEDPTINLILFSIAVSTGCLRLFDYLPSPWGLPAVGALLLLISKILFFPKREAGQLSSASVGVLAFDQLQQCVSEQASPAAGRMTAVMEPLKKSVQRFFNGFGDQARYDYFAQRVEREDPTNEDYRCTFANLQVEDKYWIVAQGIDEWVTIGFDTLKTKNSRRWANSGTINQLYAALYRVMEREEFNVKGGRQLADEVAERIAQLSREGY